MKLAIHHHLMPRLKMSGFNLHAPRPRLFHGVQGETGGFTDHIRSVYYKIKTYCR